MDIDIDFKTTFKPTSITDRMVPASMIQRGELVQHPCGYYMQNVPVDGVTSLAAIPYKDAEAMGYFKIDCLHLTVLDDINTKADVRRLANSEPDWTLLSNRSVVEQLFQISKHFDIVSAISPTSVLELADCIALIRPGKNHLLHEYIAGDRAKRASMRPRIYAKQDGGYYYKKPHAVSYALTIVIQLNLFRETRINT